MTGNRLEESPGSTNAAEDRDLSDVFVCDSGEIDSDDEQTNFGFVKTIAEYTHSTINRKGIAKQSRGNGTTASWKNDDWSRSLIQMRVEIPSPLSPRSVDKSKDPLAYRWILWYLEGNRDRDWEQCLGSISDFDTVQDFWILISTVESACNLLSGSDYFVFKEGIKPMWEDPNNIYGGRWVAQIPRDEKRMERMEFYWINFLLCMIGNAYGGKCGKIVSGLVCNARAKGDKVSLWIADAREEEIVMEIGQCLKKYVFSADEEKGSLPLKFEVHGDVAYKPGPVRKAKFYIS